MQDVEATPEKLTLNQWSEKVKNWVNILNSDGYRVLLEVGEDGFFLAGDLIMMLSKEDINDFDAIAGAKPGIWSVSIDTQTIMPNDGFRLKTIRRTPYLVWIGHGSVDYDAMPLSNDMGLSQPGTEWDVVGNFGVDSGNICLFSKHALHELLSLGDESYQGGMLETLADFNTFDKKSFVPGGVVLSGNDGGYDVEGRRDADGLIVEVRFTTEYYTGMG